MRKSSTSVADECPHFHILIFEIASIHTCFMYLLARETVSNDPIKGIKFFVIISGTVGDIDIISV